MGKSRILTEFLRSARDSGDTVVQTGPDPFWSEVGYYALRRAIAGLAGLPVSGGKPADVWLMLGDNAYNTGTDAEHQSAVFDMYPDTLRNTALRRVANALAKEPAPAEPPSLLQQLRELAPQELAELLRALSGATT